MWLRLPFIQNPNFSSKILDEISEKIQVFETWLRESGLKFNETTEQHYDEDIDNKVTESLSIINELMNECEYRRSALLGGVYL